MNQIPLCRCSYGPYARAMVRICKEESFHQRQGYDIMLSLVRGTQAQYRMAQDALDRWWWPALMMFGTPDADSQHSAQSLRWKVKRFTNDELRERFIEFTVPQAEFLGLEVPQGTIDWNEFHAVLNGSGPCNRERLEARRRAHEQGRWVREAALAYAEKQRSRQREAV